MPEWPVTLNRQLEHDFQMRILALVVASYSGQSSAVKAASLLGNETKLDSDWRLSPCRAEKLRRNARIPMSN